MSLNFGNFLVGNAEAAFGAYTGNPALVAAGSAKSGGALLSSGGGKDPERARRAHDSAILAIGGDLSSAQEVLQLRFNSATAYGKQQYEIAWQNIVAQNSAIAQEALKTRINTSSQSDNPSVRDKLNAEWNNLVASVRQDVGNTIQRVGSGMTTGAAGVVDPNTSRFTLPLGGSSSMLYIGIAIALAVGAVLYFGRKR